MSPIALFALSVLFSAIPAGLYAFLIWWLDWYERESPRMILLSFFWGAIIAAGVGAFSEFILHIPLLTVFKPEAADFLMVTFGAPLIEEGIKGALLLLILFNTEFDNLTDGIVYGAIIGLGFSASENTAYFFNAFTDGGALVWLSNILFRSSFCCALHATATAITGAAIGVAKFSRRHSRMFIISTGFAMATAVHMGWNGFLSLGEFFNTGLLAFVSIVALPVVGIIVGSLFLWSISRERALIRRELGHEATAGWLPEAHVEIVATLSKRLRTDWLPPHIDQHGYIRTLTELAFRRSQLRFMSHRQRPYYERLVEDLRQLGQQLLQPTPHPVAPSPAPLPLAVDAPAPPTPRPPPISLPDD